jgi:hypothetical protein
MIEMLISKIHRIMDYPEPLLLKMQHPTGSYRITRHTLSGGFVLKYTHETPKATPSSTAAPWGPKPPSLTAFKLKDSLPRGEPGTLKLFLSLRPGAVEV